MWLMGQGGVFWKNKTLEIRGVGSGIPDVVH